MKTAVVKIALALLVFFFTISLQAKSQKNVNKIISVSVEKKELSVVLSLIQAQTGIRFTYSSDVVDMGQKISCNLVKKSLGEFLETVLKPLNIQYRFIDEKQILLFVPVDNKNGNQASLLPDDLLFTVSAKVTDVDGEPLAGVTVIEKGTNNGTATDDNGMYRLTVHQNAILVFSLIGYAAKEIKAGQVKMFSITLSKEIKPIDELIVTGVFDKRTRIESAVAITTLDAADIEKLNAVSAADLLTNVPGVFVNSSLGEIRNMVYSRGISANSTDGAAGYYYVSMQEDGLPVTNVTFNNFGPDYFYRADASLKRLEAVRGGTASILGANAPGGIFNYISKTGGERFAGLITAKYGIEGNGNGYYRGDINLGGPLKKGWYYNIGGFYRYSLGARYPGYPLNYGGQVKGNILKQYKKGYLKFYAKYLNDHNGWFEFLPAKNFDDPKLAPGVKQTDSYLLPGTAIVYPFLSADQFKTFDPKILVQSKDIAVGQNLEQNLGKGWKINNNLKYAQKKHNWQSSAVIFPLSLDNSTLYNLLGTEGKAGIYTFTSTTTGKVLAQSQSVNGNDYKVLNSNLPGAGILPHSLLTQIGFVNFTNVNEWINQFSATKKTKRMSFTGGIFYAHSRVNRVNGVAGTGLGTIENRPYLTDISFTENTGRQYKITNDVGYTNLGVGFRTYKARHSDLATFFGHTWQIDHNWTLDWGGRFERISVKGTNNIDNPNMHANDPAYGGLDGNPATIYDNVYTVAGTAYHFGHTIQTFSYSAGLNYKINNHLAIYGRYARGQKAPDLAYYFAYDSKIEVEKNKPKAQTINQAEVGLKVTTSKFKLFVTPFYSLLSDVYSLDAFQNTSGGFYVPFPLYNSVRTFGIELETDYKITSSFHVRSTATLQTAKARSWDVWIANALGEQDDSIVHYTGKKADNNPDVIFNFTPSYNADRLYAFLTWKYMGKRPGNIPNTITLPGFSQFDIGIWYNINKNFIVRGNINNLLNSEGVMSWSPPAKFFDALDRQGFTKEKLAANPDATFGIVCIQPRAFFLTFSFLF
jgi:outer membrane receptor protein involved in Fe transport